MNNSCLKILRNSLHQCLSIIAVLVMGSAAYGDSSVWEVSEGENILYLGGTIHVLRASDYPLPQEYEQAYANADTLVFEIDPSSMGDMSVQAKLLQALTYTGETSLKTVLSDQAYSALSDYADTVGIPLMMLEKFKPGMVITTFQLLEMQKIGFTPEGVDVHFSTRGLSDGKTIEQLETIEEQIGFLASMGEGNESEFVLSALEELGETEAVMEDMIEAWRSGDNKKLVDLFIADMKEETPELYASLLLRRNHNWMPQIQAMLRTGETEFILVGAAHLIGEDGVLNLLEKQGYTIRQL